MAKLWGIVLACWLLLVASASAEEASACQVAAQVAERAQALPPGLLPAIGQVESGRRDPVTGRVAAWPWTINAAGMGRLFDRREDAIIETQALQARGVTSVDVGCFQVNLFYHPTAFASLEEAFDPQANAAYAARFLSALHTRTGSWDSAVAAYHSATPERGGPYRDRVIANLEDGRARWDRQPEIGLPVRQVMVWMPMQGVGKMQVWTPSTLGQAASVISIWISADGPQIRLPVVAKGP
jgi:hypothetical protein